MRVERLMTIMTNEDSIIGYIKVERVGTRLTLSLDVRDMTLDDCLAVLHIGELCRAIPCEKLQDGITMSVEDETVGTLSAVIFAVPSGKIIAKGSNNIMPNPMEYMPQFEEYISQNNGTYIGVKSHIHDMVVESSSDETVEDMESISVSNPIEEDKTDEEKLDDVEAIGIDGGQGASIVLDKVDNVKYSDGAPFYGAISAQLEDIFARYEREEILEKAITGSRFARIYYEDDRYYVVGEVLNEQGTPELICYGYPGESDDMPPSEVTGSYEWLPLDRDNAKSHGYFMMYQNAVTGDIIEN